MQSFIAIAVAIYLALWAVDDGVAWRAAEGLQKKFPHDEVEILSASTGGPNWQNPSARRDA